MRRVSLTVARLCSAMWVGAALLFVATSVTEQVQDSFTADTKDTLALIRFPWYYGAGFSLLSMSLLAACFSGMRRHTGTIVAALLASALCLMIADYAFVYRPMRDLLSQQGREHGGDFERLHHWSEFINSVGFLFSTGAAITLCASRGEYARSATSNREAERAA